MAIAFDASTLGTANTATFSHTCTGSNLLLIVGVEISDTTSVSISAPTYNSVTMTLLTNVSAGLGYNIYLYGLVAPTTGANTVSISTGNTNYRGFACSYTGVDQYLTSINKITGTGSSVNTLTITNTVTYASSWIVATGSDYRLSATSTINAGRTSRQNWNRTKINANDLAFCLEDSNGVVSTGSVGTTFTGNATQFVIQELGIVIAPAGSTQLAPTVTTTAVSNITTNSIDSGGNVTSQGTAAVTTRGICWSSLGTPTISDSILAVGSGTGVFSGTASSLTNNTLYYIRAYATNSVGTSYGSVVSSTTLQIILSSGKFFAFF